MQVITITSLVPSINQIEQPLGYIGLMPLFDVFFILSLLFEVFFLLLFFCFMLCNATFSM